MSSYHPWPLPERYALVEHSFAQRGDAAIGYLNLAYLGELPFEVRRVFWVTDTPPQVVRGGHAHFLTEELLIAVRGQIEIRLEWPDGSVIHAVAADPQRAVYIPPYAWRELHYSADAVQLVLASSDYDPAEYIRDKDAWRRAYGR